MNAADVLFESSIPELPLLGRGKVRDIYGVDDDHLLIVTTDRLSAYDVVMPDPVPGKGEILTRISLFWFRMMADIWMCQSTRFPICERVEKSQGFFTFIRPLRELSSTLACETVSSSHHRASST